MNTDSEVIEELNKLQEAYIERLEKVEQMQPIIGWIDSNNEITVINKKACCRIVDSKVNIGQLLKKIFIKENIVPKLTFAMFETYYKKALNEEEIEAYKKGQLEEKLLPSSLSEEALVIVKESPNIQEFTMYDVLYDSKKENRTVNTKQPYMNERVKVGSEKYNKNKGSKFYKLYPL